MDRLAVLRTVRGLDELSPSTQRLHVACLRGLLRAAGAAPQVVVAARAPRAHVEPSGRALSLDEQQALLGACRSSRDRALVLVMIGSGVRVAELVALDVIDLMSAVLTVRSGKGRRPREVALPSCASAALREYVGARADGPLFATKGGGRLSPRGVQRLLATLSRRAAIERVTPHDLRRTCATTAAAAGAPIEAVGAHLGHALVTTTQRYLRADPLVQSRRVAALLDTAR